MRESRFATRRMLFGLLGVLIISGAYGYGTHSASGCTRTIPFLLLIFIGSLPSSLGRGRHRGRSGFGRLLPFLCTRMLPTWGSSSRAGSPKTKTFGIRCGQRAGQEVAKRRRQVWGILEKFFNLCKNFSLPTERQQGKEQDIVARRTLFALDLWLARISKNCLYLSGSLLKRVLMRWT